MENVTKRLAAGITQANRYRRPLGIAMVVLADLVVRWLLPRR